MSEQVPEVREAIERQRRERASSGGSLDAPPDVRHDRTSIDPWLWGLVAGSVLGTGALAVAQAWFFRRPQPNMTLSLLFSVGFMILAAVLVAGIVGVVVSIQLRRDRRRMFRAARSDVLAELVAEGAIDAATLGRMMRDDRDDA